ncbi:MAG: circularly permuted type 2 ATP-grasp protein [Magnetococcales bacterium]|nr:circularly permuted type 2 ATP-grasp protein [Magnetococcales bacterium]
MILKPDMLAGSSLEQLLKDYNLSGGWDEMFSSDGMVRPVWQEILEQLEQMGLEQVGQHHVECQRLLRESGLTHNLYGSGNSTKRLWELDLLPYPIDNQEWLQLERGLQQRVRLLGRILTDLTGPEKLLKDGTLPAELFFSHPAWHPTWKGAHPPEPKTAPLTFCAIDLVRGGDGRFFVQSDHLDTPSGLGFVLENRMILSRVVPGFFKKLNVRRLLPFFSSLRSNLELLSPNNQEDPHIILMADAKAQETHFEQVFLANYLGLTLAQSDDLTIRNGRLTLKTLDGLRPVDVILRRVADMECDPLELFGECRQGVAGLIHALRRGSLAMANPLGTGMMENLGLIPFLPNLCRTLLGEELLLPSTPTWWCGDRLQYQYVKDNFDQLVIKPLRPLAREPAVSGAQLDKTQREQLLERIRRNPAQYVGQQRFLSGTTPILSSDRIKPEAMVIRTFITANSENMEVLPGGLVRLSSREGALKEGRNISKGVWVLSDEPAPLKPRVRSLRPIEEAPLVGELPSRVAENLFWIGRYAERAEYSIRIIRVILLLWNEESGLPDDQRLHCLRSLLVAFAQITGAAPGFLGKEKEAFLADPEKELLAAIVDNKRNNSLSNTLESLVYSAQTVRERFSVDTWQVIQEIIKRLEGLQPSPHLKLKNMRREIDAIITLLMVFSGQTIESMTQGQGWRFINSGRRLERAIFTIGLVEGTLAKEIHTQHESAIFECLLSITESLITFRRRYRSRLEARPVLDLILLDETNPRSLAFQIQALDDHTAHLPRARHLPSHRSPEGRLTLEALSALRLAVPEQLASLSREEAYRPNLAHLLSHISTLLPLYSVTLSNSFFQHTQLRKRLAAIF